MSGCGIYVQKRELFGAARGAYTGAAADRIGLIESANGGTLFLDEVGEMDLITQAKLLRFLEQGEIRRLGETRVRTVDVRVVAATNQNLQGLVEAKKFRPDLYYRLCGAPLRIPDLSERPADVPLLFRYFLGRVERRYAFAASLAPRLEEHLMGLRWPGNVRQLRNEVERAAVLAEGEGRVIGVGDFHREEMSAVRPAFAVRVEAFERGLIEEALERTGWNRTRAAEYLGGMKRTTLIGKMQRLGVKGPEER